MYVQRINSTSVRQSIFVIWSMYSEAKYCVYIRHVCMPKENQFRIQYFQAAKFYTWIINETNILRIPGTLSVIFYRECLDADMLSLPGNCGKTHTRQCRLVYKELCGITKTIWSTDQLFWFGPSRPHFKWFLRGENRRRRTNQTQP